MSQVKVILIWGIVKTHEGEGGVSGGVSGGGVMSGCLMIRCCFCFYIQMSKEGVGRREGGGVCVAHELKINLRQLIHI